MLQYSILVLSFLLIFLILSNSKTAVYFGISEVKKQFIYECAECYFMSKEFHLNLMHDVFEM